MNFRRYFFERALNSFVTWVLVLILNFFLFYIPSVNGGLAAYPSQILEYLKFVFVDRFGPYSLSNRMPTLDYVASLSTCSLILLALSLAIAIALGIFLGTFASYEASSKHGKKIDAVLTAAALITFSLPVWWVALVLRDYLYPPFHAMGWYSVDWVVVGIPGARSAWSDIPGFILDFLNHLFLPLLTFIITLTGIYVLVARNNLRKVYTEDYMLTAKAKGCSPLRMMFKHALKNASIPVVSIVALTPPLIVLAVIMNEQVFSRSGLGQQLLKSSMDLITGNPAPPTPILQALFLVFATVIIILQFIVDISVCFLDPRTRTDGAGLATPTRQVKTRDFREPFHRRLARFVRQFMKGYSGKFGLGVILFFVIAGLSVPFLPLPHPDDLLHHGNPWEPPSLSHLFGTDEFGRDVFAMVLWGARASLLEGLGAVALALAIGYLVGLISGYYCRSWIGYLLDRVTDLFLVVPIIVIAVYFPNLVPYTPTPVKWVLAIGLTTWTFTAKLVRAEVMSARGKAFIEVSRASGAGDFHIIFRSLLPYCVPAVVSSVPLLAVTALSTQSCLDVLGFQRNLMSRIDPVLLAPYTSWGTILSYNAAYVSSVRTWWWLAYPPAICIALVVLALIAIGNKVMEVAYPRLAT